jgi:hypothetical protein
MQLWECLNPVLTAITYSEVGEQSSPADLIINGHWPYAGKDIGNGQTLSAIITSILIAKHKMFNRNIKSFWYGLYEFMCGRELIANRTCISGHVGSDLLDDLCGDDERLYTMISHTMMSGIRLQI